MEEESKQKTGIGRKSRTDARPDAKKENALRLLCRTCNESKHAQREETTSPSKKQTQKNDDQRELVGRT